MSGRPPKPTALKALEGGRGHRTKAEKAKAEREPKPPRDCPNPPPWLDAAAKRKWRSLADELNTMGVLTSVDGDVLACYCDAYSRLVCYTQFLREHGDTNEYSKTDESGEPFGLYVQVRPEVALRNRAVDDLKKWGAELGIGAAARTKIEVKPKDAGPSTLEKVRQRTRR